MKISLHDCSGPQPPSFGSVAAELDSMADRAVGRVGRLLVRAPFGARIGFPGSPNAPILSWAEFLGWHVFDLIGDA